jgi:hypothetical protein
MANMSTPKMPSWVKMPKPKTDIAPARNPLPTSGGKDIISITTRMKETPMKKGKY